jgi:hypothetical protein
MSITAASGTVKSHTLALTRAVRVNGTNKFLIRLCTAGEKISAKISARNSL